MARKIPCKEIRDFAYSNAASRLHSIRKGSGSTLQDIGDILGCDATLISKHERGKCMISIDYLIDYCFAYGVTPNDILGIDEETIQQFGTARKRKLIREEIKRLQEELDTL